MEPCSRETPFPTKHAGKACTQLASAWGTPACSPGGSSKQPSATAGLKSAPRLQRLCKGGDVGGTSFAQGLPVLRQSQGGRVGAGCPPCLSGHPKPQHRPCSASSPGPGGATPAAGWSCPSSARTAVSLVPICRVLRPVTPKSSPRRWRGPSRTQDWSHSPPSPSLCTGGSEVGRRGPLPCSRDTSRTQGAGFVPCYLGSCPLGLFQTRRQPGRLPSWASAMWAPMGKRPCTPCGS